MVELTAGPDVCKLAQVKVGDRVVVEYLEALSLTLKKGGKVEPTPCRHWRCPSSRHRRPRSSKPAALGVAQFVSHRLLPTVVVRPASGLL